CFFLQFRSFLDIFNKFDLFLPFEHADFGANLRSIYCRGFKLSAPPPRSSLHRDNFSVSCWMRVQLRSWRNRTILQDTVWLVIAPAHINILTEAPGAFGIHQFLVQLLVVNTANAA